MKKKKGFTLVELLAVIVILAIILIISIPQILNTINTSRLASFKSSAELVLTEAEKQYMIDQTEKADSADDLSVVKYGGITTKSSGVNETCGFLTELSVNDYATCEVTVSTEGVATLTEFTGKGKFKGYSCTGTKGNITCEGAGDNTNSNNNNNNPDPNPQTGDSYINANGDTCIVSATDGAKTLYDLAVTDDIDLYIDENCEVRYGGNSESSGYYTENHVYFNDEDWRIVGVLKTKKSTSSPEEYRIKLIRSIPLGASSFGDTNDWATSTAKTIVNDNYLSSEGWQGYSLSSTAQSYIDDAVWYLGAVDDSSTAAGAYAQERTGATWTGKVGLIYPSDYGYSWDYDTCVKVAHMNNIYNGYYSCHSYPHGSYLHYDVFYDGWSTYGGHTWTMNPGTFSPTTSMIEIYSGTDISDSAACEGYYCDYTDNLGVNPSYAIVPVVYLKANVKITGGNGDNGSEYTLGF